MENSYVAIICHTPHSQTVKMKCNLRRLHYDLGLAPVSASNIKPRALSYVHVILAHIWNMPIIRPIGEKKSVASQQELAVLRETQRFKIAHRFCHKTVLSRSLGTSATCKTFWQLSEFWFLTVEDCTAKKKVINGNLAKLLRSPTAVSNLLSASVIISFGSNDTQRIAFLEVRLIRIRIVYPSQPAKINRDPAE